MNYSAVENRSDGIHKTFPQFSTDEGGIFKFAEARLKPIEHNPKLSLTRIFHARRVEAKTVKNLKNEFKQRFLKMTKKPIGL